MKVVVAYCKIPYHPSIYLERLSNTTKYPNQDT
jgi:hypothetical protein